MMRYLILLALMLCLPVRGEAWQVVGAVTQGGGTSYFLVDRLYESSSTAIASHSADTGGTGWNNLVNTNVSTDGVTGPAGQSILYHTNATPSSADYTVRVKGTLSATVSWDRRIGPVVRYNATNGYCVVVERTGSFSIKKIVSNAITDFSPNVATTVTVDGTTEYTVELNVSGETLTAKLFNGETQVGSTITKTDSTYSSAGVAGFVLGRVEPRITDIEAYQ